MVGIPVDTTFDVRTDAGGRDPDRYSATLRAFHRALWSKPLPGGDMFELDRELSHASPMSTLRFASDAITHTYATWTGPRALVETRNRIPAHKMKAFVDLGCTVGAYTIFPRKVQVDGRWCISINQARGMHPLIRDRFDLTLECIRRHYLGLDHPLGVAFGPYSDFFALFDDFAGYVRFFLLQDLVTEDLDAVRFLVEFDEFQRTPLPSQNADEYRAYMDKSMAFIRARNGRIDRFANGV